jgi:NAD(P)-dependent dehydrogenase (short-subunit alcohol dehydrogenase family)
LFGLSGKVSVVTGSGRGLGKVMAQGLAAAGAAVVVCSRTLGEAEQTAQDIVGAGGAAAATRVDISDRKSCRNLIEFAVERFRKIDVLVNNAGVTFISPAEDCTEAEWDQTLETNLKGYFLCSQLAARQMMAQGAEGSIINISSIASAIGAHGLQRIQRRGEPDHPRRGGRVGAEEHQGKRRCPGLSCTRHDQDGSAHAPGRGAADHRLDPDGAAREARGVRRSCGLPGIGGFILHDWHGAVRRRRLHRNVTVR